MPETWMINLSQSGHCADDLVQQPSSDTPPTTELDDSYPLLTRGIFLSLLLLCSLLISTLILQTRTLE